jgi:hypothetical protein
MLLRVEVVDFKSSGVKRLFVVVVAVFLDNTKCSSGQ